MADAPHEEEPGPRRRHAVAARLAQTRWTLAASAAAIGATAWAAGASPWIAAAAFAAVVAVGAIVPRRVGAGGIDRRVAAAGLAPTERMSAPRIAAAVPDPLIVFDARGTIVHANPAAEITFGPVLRGVDIQLRFRAPELQELVAGAIAGASDANHVDYAERLPIERLYRVSVTAMGEGSGLFVLLFRDQSEIRRIDRMRADFIANASHELRTPLASIAGFLETLSGPARNDEKARDRFIEIMQAQTGRMARLIDDLLSLSRLEMKAYVKSAERVDLVAVVSGVADALAGLASDAGVAIEKDLSAGPVDVPGNRDELTQVFENLVENAIKYGRSGKRVVISIFRGEQAGKPEARVAVRDFGPGIAEEHIPRVTERFYRVETADASQKGTGLGLAIVKHILTRHGGRLSIETRPGEGTTFTVHLPLG